MATKPRSEIIDPRATGVYHCWSRCVRRAFLCGVDKHSGRNYEHRRDWIEQRVQELARWFAIDVIFFAIMQNHFHLVLRNLPQLVAEWSDKQVLERAIQIFPYKFRELGVEEGAATREQLRRFAKDRELVEEMRLRLSDPSWFLRQLKQQIATRSNLEDDVSGHFFEGRFKCRAVTDETGLLICGVYVDLNQIRAGEADSIESSVRTSAYRRFKGLQSRRRQGRNAAKQDGFLCPLHTRGDGQQRGYPKAGCAGGLRASDQGVLEMTVEEYLKCLDWAGRQVQRGKRGKIAEDAPPILARLELGASSFITMVEEFEELFHTAVGTAESLAQFTLKTGQRWLRGAKAVAQTATR